MNYYDSIILINLFIIIQILITIQTNFNLSKRNKKILLISYLILGMATISEWLQGTLNGNTIIIINIKKLVNIIELTSLPIFLNLYANMLINDLKNIKNRKQIKRLSNFTYVFLCIYVGVISISIYCNNKFQGLSDKLYVLICIISIIYFLEILFLYDRYYQNGNIISLIGTICLGVIGIVVQFIKPEVKIGKLSLVCASVFIYMYYNENSMYVDQITELLNQAAYKKRVENIKNQATILLFDVDSFKEINDNYGHNFGDFILNIIGKSIKEVYSQYGHCYRRGGDEFCVILSSEQNYEDLNSQFVMTLERIRKSEPRIPYVSIGCAQFDSRKQNIYEAIENADKDLYFWKEQLKKKRQIKCECVKNSVLI